MQSSNGENTKRFMDKGRRKEGDGKMNGESSMEAHILTYVYQTARGNLLHDRELTLGLRSNPEGGKGWEVRVRFKRLEETYVHLWLIHVDV